MIKIIFLLISIIGGALLRPKKHKITAKTWEKYNHKDVII